MQLALSVMDLVFSILGLVSILYLVQVFDSFNGGFWLLFFLSKGIIAIGFSQIDYNSAANADLSIMFFPQRQTFPSYGPNNLFVYEPQQKPGPKVLKLSSCSTRLSMKFQRLISMKMSRNSAVSGSDKPRMLFFLLINFKMPTIV